MTRKEQHSTRLGERKYNKDGELMTIVEYNKYSDITVEFDDEKKHRVKSQYGHFKAGNIENVARIKEERIGTINKCNSHPYSMKVIDYVDATHVLVEFEDGRSSRKWVTWDAFLRGSVKNDNDIIQLKTRKKIQYDISGEYGIGTLENGFQFYFDIEDYELIKHHQWHEFDGYLQGTCIEKGKRAVDKFMHTLLVEKYIDPNYREKGLVCDHINRNRNDNRKSNLRLVTRAENNRNSDRVENGGYRKNRKNKWDAYITQDGNTYFLGSFEKEEEAIAARQKGKEAILNNEYNKLPTKRIYDKYEWNGKLYYLSELCRIFNKDYGNTRYLISKYHKTLFELFGENIKRIKG